MNSVTNRPSTVFAAPTSCPAENTPEEQIKRFELEESSRTDSLAEIDRASHRAIIKRAVEDLWKEHANLQRQGQIASEICIGIRHLIENHYRKILREQESLWREIHSGRAPEKTKRESLGQKIARARVESFKVDPLVRNQASGERIDESPAAIDMKERKAKLAQCLLTSMDPESPFGAMPCLAHHAKGLSAAEEKELSAAVPNLVAGKVITELAAVPAAVSAVANLAIKGLVLGSAAEGLLQADPAHFQERMEEVCVAFNGQNPQFNAAVSKLTPEWAKSVGRVIQKGVDYAGQVDQYTQQQFYTPPGIVQAGIVGTAEIATMAVAGPAVKYSLRATRSIAGGVSRAYQSIGGFGSDTGNCFYRMDTALQHVAQREITSINHPKMAYYIERSTDQLAYQIPDLTKLIKQLPYLNSFDAPRVALIQSITGNRTVAVSAIERGVFSQGSYKVAAGPHKLIIIETDADTAVKKFIGLNQFHLLNLTQAVVSKPLAIGKYHGDYLLAMPEVEGSLASIFESSQKSMSELCEIFHDAGMAYGELHSKYAVSLSPADPLHKEFISQFMGQLEDMKSKFVSGKASGKVMLNPTDFHLLSAPEKTLGQYPVKVGMTQGNAHLGSIAWNAEARKIEFIDLDFFTHTLTVDGQPCSYPVMEYGRFLADITERGAKLGMDSDKIIALKDAFKSGYKKRNIGDHPMIEELALEIHQVDSLFFRGLPDMPSNLEIEIFM